MPCFALTVGLSCPDGKLHAWYVEKSKKQPPAQKGTFSGVAVAQNGDKLGV